MTNFSELIMFDDWPKALNWNEIPLHNSMATSNFIFKSRLEKKIKILDFQSKNFDLADFLLSLGGNFSIVIYNEGLKVNHDKCIVTSSFEEVTENGPYDVILTYDLFNEADDPVSVLQLMKSLCKSDGFIHCRAYPWCSRLALCKNNDFAIVLNKAFCHFFLTTEEMCELTDLEAKDFMPIRKVLYPYETYSNWIHLSGLKIVENHSTIHEVEKFFTFSDMFSSRFLEAFETNVIPNELFISYLDYKIAP